MEKNKFTFFNFLRDLIHFIKILIVFSMMMLLLYWVQNLISISWDWFKPFVGFFEKLVNISERISSGSIVLFGTEIEYKYYISIFILIVFYAIIHLFYVGVGVLEDMLSDLKLFIKEHQEKKFNKKLRDDISKQQKEINRYQIYIQAQPKSSFEKFDLEEQNQKLIKHLKEKTGVTPANFNDGFIFDFDAFNAVDAKLDIFSNLISSESSFNYIICIQVKDSIKKYDEQLKTLINLRIYDKIVMMSNTAYRYKFNDFKGYKIASLGIYQNNGKAIEVHEFIKNL